MRIQNSQSGSINFRSTQYPSVSACLYECVNFKQPPLSRLTCVSSAVAVGNDFGAHLIGTSVCGAIRSKCFQDGHFYNEVIGQILLRRLLILPIPLFFLFLLSSVNHLLFKPSGRPTAQPLPHCPHTHTHTRPPRSLPHTQQHLVWPKPGTNSNCGHSCGTPRSYKT